MYEEVTSSVGMKRRKLGMSLDLQSTKPQLNGVVIKQEVLNNEILSTPDLGLFMLASPDLELLLINQQNGMVLTTPTPTTQILFPRSVTEEQEAYARGFVDALGDLYRSYGKPETGVSSSTGPETPATEVATEEIFEESEVPIDCVDYEVSTEDDVPYVDAYTTLSTTDLQMHGKTAKNITTYTPQASKPTIRSSGIVTRSATGSTKPTPRKIIEISTSKVETKPQVIRSRSISLVSSLADDGDEMEKLERKRARNRLAATRCRNRKLEKISRLEERVSELREENDRLVEESKGLRDQVYRLKQSLLEHTQQGCHVVINHDFTFSL